MGVVVGGTLCKQQYTDMGGGGGRGSECDPIHHHRGYDLTWVVLHHDYDDCTVKSVDVQCVRQTADSRSCDFVEGDVIL